MTSPAEELLTLFRLALDRLKQAKTAREKLDKLGRASVEKGKQISEQLTKTAAERSEPFDAKEWNDQYDALLENLDVYRASVDTETITATAFVNLWHTSFGLKPVSAALLLPYAEPSELGGKNDASTRIRLGKWLERHANQVIGHWRVRRAGHCNGSQRWELSGVNATENGNPSAQWEGHKRNLSGVM